MTTVSLGSVLPRQTKAGTVYRALWREDGRQQNITFLDEASAWRFQRVRAAAGTNAALEDARAVENRSDHTVTTWVLHYIEHRSKIHSGTRAEYERMWARTFAPLIGDIPLELLTRDMVSLAVIDLAHKPRPKPPKADGTPRPDGPPLSSKSIKNARDMLASALKLARKDGIVTRVATEDVEIPRVTADADDRMRILTMAEWRRIEAEIPDYWLAILRLLVGTGMRVNEATALRVGSVDLEGPSVRITRGYRRVKKGWEPAPPKTRKSVRTVELDPAFRSILAPYVEGRQADELLFTSKHGQRVHDGNLRSRVWQPACRRAGIIPAPTVHALRHTHASWLIAAGEDMAVVQARLGHESVSTTIDVYTHLVPDTRRRAATVAVRAFTDRAAITAG